jgi:hypothetical protein
MLKPKLYGIMERHVSLLSSSCLLLPWWIRHKIKEMTIWQHIHIAPRSNLRELSGGTSK